MRKEWFLRWSFFIVGLMILAFGISLTIKGKNLGIGPWDVFHYGLFLKFGLTIGSWSIISGCILLLISSVIKKEWPRLGALCNMLFLGLFIDLFNWLLPPVDSLIGESVVYVLGVIFLGYGIGLYVSADLGAGPRDNFMLLIIEKTGWSIPWVRNGIEIFIFLIGWLLGGPVGIGTVLIAFGLGPILGISIPHCQKVFSLFLKQGNSATADTSIR
ncbi:YitT family protein [Bacillus sp. S/N-304-OC-R1]|uniref:YczE/YyaS/YitT family protein n=1 Tax=Bacillus sp. S/N-304-OC-R1 TaxID=2758034 RepID=UPI001C8D2628|nr:YitT family protein [Bacillus sp. S/N-304-OC-R1]MBY0121485.1 YitT family protein [Bacillus sp. S/N-304-OC-R1]